MVTKSKGRVVLSLNGGLETKYNILKHLIATFVQCSYDAKGLQLTSAIAIELNLPLII